MSAFPDSSVLRRRRTVEAFSLLTRGSGLAATVLFVGGLLGDGAWAAPTDSHVRVMCLIGIALMSVGTLLTLLNLRRPGGRRYILMSGAQVACDMIAIGGIVTAIQASTGQTTWPLLAVSVVIAALRLRLAGAMTVWAVSSCWLAVAVHVLGEQVNRPGDLLMAVTVNFMIAVLSGIQASAFGRQVDELQEVRRQLHHQATHDVLTGLPNRERLMAYGAELDGRPVAVLLLDLDGFKRVNDTHGHAAGDELLREVSRRLSANLRDGDLAVRLGGDEFVVVLPDTDRDTVAVLAGRLRAEIRRPVDVPGGRAEVGVSIGAACRAAGEDTDITALALAADTAMYREKASSASLR
ncbi:MAG: GGDEF domain-containing protein [Actinoplanes sp.]